MVMKIVSMLYVLSTLKNTTDKISKVLKKYNVDTIFMTNKKISNILPTHKEIIPLEDQGVYEIPCGGCNKSYVGQTNRRISVRRDEHKNAVAQRIQNSSLAQHVLSTGHKIDFKNTKTIAKSENLTTRMIREAIEI